MAIAGLYLGATISANAALDFSLTSGNTAISGYSGPYGSVSLTRVGNNDATVQLTAATGYTFGDGQTLDINLAGGGTFTISSLSGTVVGGGAAVPGNYSVDVAGNVDGFGVFTFRLDTADGFKDSVTSLSFNIHTTSGAWTSESAMLLSGVPAVAGHVFVLDSTGKAALATGFATVPEPTTIIAGIGALGLLLFGAGVHSRRSILRIGK